MMRRRTRFDPDQAWRQLAKILQHLCTTDALADHNRARNIYPVHLEYRLRNIETNRANLAHGRLPSIWFALTQPPYGTSMPQSGRRPQHHFRTSARFRPMSALSPRDGVIGRPSLWIAEEFWVLRFRLMVKRGPWLRPQASEGEAQHGPFCWIRRIGQGDQHLHCG